MKKITFLFAFATLLFISCGETTAVPPVTKEPAAEQVAKQPATAPAPVEKTYTPTEIGLTELKVEKNDGGECGGEGNVFVSYEIFVKLDTAFSDNLRVNAWDCGEGMMNGKEAQEEYNLLKNCKAEELLVIVTETGGQRDVKKIFLKEKWIAGKNGKPATVIPARDLRGFSDNR